MKHKHPAFCWMFQIVDKLNENINWAIPNWYFHFFMLKIFIYHSKYKKRKHIGVILAPFFACTIPVS